MKTHLPITYFPAVHAIIFKFHSEHERYTAVLGPKCHCDWTTNIDAACGYFARLDVKMSLGQVCYHWTTPWEHLNWYMHMVLCCLFAAVISLIQPIYVILILIFIRAVSPAQGESYGSCCQWSNPRGCDWGDLTHWGRDEIDAITQTTFSNGFSWMKMFEFRLKFHWSLFPRVQLTIFQHWFR